MAEGVGGTAFAGWAGGEAGGTGLGLKRITTVGGDAGEERGMRDLARVLGSRDSGEGCDEEEGEDGEVVDHCEGRFCD